MGAEEGAYKKKSPQRETRVGNKYTQHPHIKVIV